MEYHCTSNNWEFCSHLQEGMEELRHTLLYTTLELETTILSAKEEILRRECEIMNLRDLLNRAIKEKDEVETKYGKLRFQNLVLIQNQKTQQPEIVPQTDSDSNKNFVCSESDDNTIQSSQTDPILRETLLSQEHPQTVCKNAYENEKPLSSQQHPPTVFKNASENEKTLSSQEFTPTVWENACENEKPLLFQEHPQTVCKNACEKSLPEKGKLLQAVIEAGPLLQNLLLAGPLPRWQHPPPLVDSTDIPPVIISPRPSLPPAQIASIDIRKRSHSNFSDVSLHCHNKHQKVVQ